MFSSALKHSCPSCGAEHGLIYKPGFSRPMGCDECRRKRGLPPLRESEESMRARLVEAMTKLNIRKGKAV